MTRGSRMQMGLASLLVGLVVWDVLPVVLMAIHALSDHLRLTGADGVIGADQLQYLSWVRDAGAHGLSSNLYELAPNGHVFLQPMFIVSSALWRIGLPIQLAYWLWKPVAAVVLGLGGLAWSTRFFASRGARDGAWVLGVFMFAPLAALALWAHLGSAATQAGLERLGGELCPALALWGYLPSAIAIGLMPLVLLAVERSLGAVVPRGRRRALASAVAGSVVISWVHPWQGITLLALLVLLGAWGRGRDWKLLAPPAIAAGLPLAYYELLARSNSAWRLASHNELAPHLPAHVLLVGLGPLVLIALAGLRRPGPDLAERALVLWVPVGLVVYFALSSDPAHMLGGLSFPLAVLTVRGAERGFAFRRGLRLSGSAAMVAGAAAVGLLSLPGLAYVARQFHRVADSPIQEYYLTSDQARALDWIAGRAPAGGVLADPLLSIAVPSQTGRAVWVGHQFWSRDYLARARLDGRLFAGLLPAAVARRTVLSTGARLVLIDCSEIGRGLGRALEPVARSAVRFGCAQVDVVR